MKRNYKKDYTAKELASFQEIDEIIGFERFGVVAIIPVYCGYMEIDKGSKIRMVYATSKGKVNEFILVKPMVNILKQLLKVAGEY